METATKLTWYCEPLFNVLTDKNVCTASSNVTFNCTICKKKKKYYIKISLNKATNKHASLPTRHTNFKYLNYSCIKLCLDLYSEYKNIIHTYILGVDRYVFFRADTDTDYYRSSRPITDILNRYTCLV